MLRRISLCYWVAAMLIILACDETDNPFELQVGNEVAVGENAMVNCIITNVIDEVECNLLTLNSAYFHRKDSLPIVKATSFKSSLETEVVIDYGSERSLDFLGQLKRGRIIGSVKGDYPDENCCFSISFDDYSINDISIEGNVEVSGKSVNLFVIVFEKLQLTDKDSMIYILSGELEKQWIEGVDTPEKLWDDISLLSGVMSGTTAENLEFTSTIVTPLLLSRACEFILYGDVSMVIERDSVIYDFGEGLCDNKGRYIKEGKTYPFEFGNYDFRYNPR